MRTNGRSIGGRPGLAFILLTALAGVALATETWVVDVPAGDAYVVMAVLVPGCEGAEVLADTKGQGHVDFRIGFGSDLALSVNGIYAGMFDPGATYLVSVECHKIGCDWFATTHVVNQSTGTPVFEQMNYRMPGAAEEVRAVAEDVVQLDVQ